MMSGLTHYLKMGGPRNYYGEIHRQHISNMHNNKKIKFRTNLSKSTLATEAPIHPSGWASTFSCNCRAIFKYRRKDVDNWFPDRYKILNDRPCVDYRFIQKGVKMFK